MTIISHRLSSRYGELCLFETLYPAPLAQPFSKGLLAEDYLIWAFMPLRRIVPLRGTLSCAFGAALLQGPTQLACWTFSHPMRQFLNAFPLREGGGQRPGWMCLIEAQICAADSSFSFYGLLISRPTASRIHPAPLARSFSTGLLARDYLTWAFIPPTAYYLPSLFAKSS